VSLSVGTGRVYRSLLACYNGRVAAKRRSPAGKQAPADTTATEDPLVAQAFDASKHDQLAAAIEQLSPEEASYFVHKLEAALRKRKLQLTGYLVAMFVWLIAMVGALVYYGLVDGFTGWVFLVPFALVGLVLWGFGRWAEHVGKPASITPK
jgi:hypothetical protein